MRKTVTIVGGGLAGLTLGIGLRQREVPVTIFEAGHYPRHRVCGEFISGRGRAVLVKLGMEGNFFTAGAREAKTAAFFSKHVAGIPQTLPGPALCLSRYIMDRLLAEEFRKLDGQLRQNQRWQEEFGEGVVRATGRRTEASSNGWRWLGLKVHARGIKPEADLEMHLFPNGYVGLCQLNADEVNICGLFRTRVAVPDLARTWREWLQGPPGSPLRQRMADAVFSDESFCSVGGLRLEPQMAASHVECSLGDAITMIAPLTGNGMSMAFESAALAIAPLESYSLGKITWSETRARIAALCDAQFARRLRWSRRLQDALFQPTLGDALVWMGSRWPALWRMLFTRTR